jgi:isopropylmalate/homocitrate/citramalate synthase
MRADPGSEMASNGQIWVSDLNSHGDFSAGARGASPVRFYDTTLRDGEQTVGVVFSPQQKLELARALDGLGIARIEAGFPRVSADDAAAFSLIARAGLKAEIWGFARAVKGDIEELLRLEARATVIEAPTSELKLQAYGISRADSIRKVADAVKFATQNGVKVAFFPVDGTRADLDHLRAVYLAALGAGATEVVVVDTLGACNPEAVGFLVSQVCGWVGPAVPVHFHGHDDFGVATACAVAAVRAGATWIQGTINGMGERAGNTDLGEVAMALRCLYGVPVEMNFDKIREVSELVRTASGYSLEPWKPVVGENLFIRESGAVASQFHIPQAIEPFAASMVHARRAIVLGKKSGLDSIDLKAKELGLTIPAEQRNPVLAAVKLRSIEKRGLVTDAEFQQIVAQHSPR